MGQEKKRFAKANAGAFAPAFREINITTVLIIPDVFLAIQYYGHSNIR